jgi:hypothetical protein
MTGRYPERQARSFPSTRRRGATILRLLDAVLHSFTGSLRDPSFSGGKKFRHKNDFSYSMRRDQPCQRPQTTMLTVDPPAWVLVAAAGVVAVFWSAVALAILSSYRLPTAFFYSVGPFNSTDYRKLATTSWLSKTQLQDEYVAFPLCLRITGRNVDVFKHHHGRKKQGLTPAFP